MKILKGEKLIRSYYAKNRDICPNSMDGKREWHMDRDKNITAILAGDIWFYYGKQSLTHYDLVCSTKAHLINSSGIIDLKNNLGYDNIVMCANKINKKEIKHVINDLGENRENSYNCRYFTDYECLIFWGPYEDVDLGVVGELVDALNIFGEDLTISFSDYNSYYGAGNKPVKIALASELNLDIKTKVKAKSPLKNLSSNTLHMISCKKKPIEGFGSFKLKCGIPISQYNILRHTGD